MTPEAPLLAILLAAAGVTTAASESTSAAATDLRSEFAMLAGARIFFGHQSVGMNVLDGLKVLAADQGLPLRIIESASATAIPPGTLAHTFIGSNGHPLQKLDAFERAMAVPDGSDPDIAFVKFCFVDFDASTDVAALFARYEATMARLKAAHPGTVFVHVTIPLTTAEHGPGDFIKRMLGRTTSSAVNARREAFSDMLRNAYRGREPLFDLARTESTKPDGTRETGRWHGRAVPALTPAYTKDGSHLDRDGSKRAAMELLSVLASSRRVGKNGH